MSEDNNNLFFLNGDDKPLYERPGRLDPDRNVPITRQSRVDVNVHYDETQKTFIRDSESPEFTEQSVNAMDPFEDSALLKGEVKPKVVGIRKNAPKVESKIFVPELDTSEVKQNVKKRVPLKQEPEPEIYIADEDKAAASDYIADAFSGVETVEKREKKTSQIVDIARLRMYVLLLGVVVILETAGIALLIAL
jgi:hypothetical protein